MRPLGGVDQSLWCWPETPSSGVSLAAIEIAFAFCRDWGGEGENRPEMLCFGDLKITSASTDRQKRSQNLAPVLVIISGNSLIFSRKLITSTDFYRYCAPDASAPVVVKKSVSQCFFPKRRDPSVCNPSVCKKM